MAKTAIKQKIRQGYKETTIGFIPKEWEVRHLGECCKGKPQYGANASSVDYDPSLPRYIRITDITEDGNLMQTDKRSIPIEKANRAILNGGDFLFARTGATVGKTYLHHSYKGVCAFAGYLIRFVPDPKILLPEYLKYYTETNKYWDWVKNTTRAGAQPNINGQEYSSLKIPCPPIHEQKSIVSVLSLWQNNTNRIRKLISVKRELKKALMQQLLTGKRRFREFKKSWKEYPIGKLIKEVRRHVEWDDNALYQLVSIRRRSGGFFLREPLNGHQIKTKVMKTTRTGDFVIAKMQVIHGAMAMTKPDFNGMHVSDSYLTFVPKDKNLLYMPFLDYLSQTPLMYYLSWRCSYGVAIEKMTFNLRWFLKEKICIPTSIEEQKQIASVLADCDKEIHSLEQKLKLLKQQKRGLMQKLLTGQIRVNI